MRISTIAALAAAAIYLFSAAVSETAFHGGGLSSGSAGDEGGGNPASRRRGAPLSPAVDRSGVKVAMIRLAKLESRTGMCGKLWSPGALLEAGREENEGWRDFEAGRFEEAEALFENSLELRRGALGRKNLEAARSLGDLATLYRAEGRLDEALPTMESAGEIREKRLPRNSPELAASFYQLARIYELAGRAGRAEEFYKKALAIWEPRLGHHNIELAVRLNRLAVLYESMGRHDDAEPLLTRALEMEEAGRVTERPQVLASLNNLAVLYFRTGRYGKAAELYKRALSNAPDIERPGILRCVEMNYAVLLARLGCTDGAVFFGKLAVNTIPGPPPAPADESASDAFELLSAGGENVYENLAGFLEKAGRPEETRRARELGERDKDALRVLNVSEEDENETPSSERMALTDSETKNWLRYDRGAQTLAKLRRERTELSEARERTTADDQRLALLGKEIRKADEAFREVIDDISGKFTGVGLRQTAHRAP